MEEILFYNKSVSDVRAMTVKHFSDDKTDFHLNDWWNHEGADLTIEKNNKKIVIDLTHEEIKGLKNLFQHYTEGT